MKLCFFLNTLPPSGQPSVKGNPNSPSLLLEVYTMLGGYHEEEDNREEANETNDHASTRLHCVHLTQHIFIVSMSMCAKYMLLHAHL